jgi:hypothetical protein
VSALLKGDLVKSRTALSRVLAGTLVLAISSTTALPARADGPPTADVANLTPPPPPPPPPSTGSTEPAHPVELLPGPHPSRLAAFLFGGVAIVGVGVGTVFGVLALNDQSSYNATPTGSSLANANQDAVIADVAFGAAVIAGVTSVVLYLRPDDAPPAPVKPAAGVAPAAPPGHVSFTVAPIARPHGAGAGVVLRF